MENRFGVKDFILFVLLGLVAVLVLLAMKQFDRQYESVRELERQGNDQLKELVAIHDALQRGIVTSTSTNPSGDAGAQGPDPFAKLRALRNEGKYDEGDWFVQNLGSTVSKLTPLLGNDEIEFFIETRVLESLVYQDPDTLDYVPLLATSWQLTDNTKTWQAYVDQREKVPLTEDEIIKEPDCPPAVKADDRKQYIAMRMKQGRTEDNIGAEPDCPPALMYDFKLRKGVTFSDGAPFTADDVVFSYDLPNNPGIDCPAVRQSLDRIKSVEKVDDYDVVFKFKTPYYQAFDLASGLWILPKHFYSKYSVDEFNNSVGLLMGTGPYQLESPTDWKPAPGGKVQLVRNERYWGLAPSFNKLVYTQVQQDSTSLVMYGNGELDRIGLTPEQYINVQKDPLIMARSQKFEYQSPLAGYSFIAWNEKLALFKDKRVRQAMTMLTDRAGMCHSIMHDYATPATGPYSTLSKQHDPNLVDWKYDPEAAKNLLKEVGFEDRGQGVLAKVDGTKFAFKLTYPSGNELIDRMMQYFKDNYRSAGVDVQLDPQDWTVFDQKLKTRDFDAISLGWGAGSMEDDIYQMFDSSQMAGDSDDFMSYANPELDATIRLARRTLDINARMELWRKCERILHDDQPYTFLDVAKSLALFDKRIANVHLARTGLNFVQDWVMPIEWYVPKAEQKYTN